MSSHMRFCVLYLGRMDFKRKHLLANGDGEENIRCLVPAILIEHPVLGNILYDTGNSPLSSTVYSEYTNENFPVTEFVSVESALKEKGIAPSDIDLLIISHLHFDHAGGMAYFKGTKAAKNVYIAEGDLRNAYYDALTRGGISPYCKESFDLEGIQFHPISGETALAEDLILFPQECHTPGVTGLILKTQNNGNVIATSDTIYTRYTGTMRSRKRISSRIWNGSSGCRENMTPPCSSAMTRNRSKSGQIGDGWIREWAVY